MARWIQEAIKKPGALKNWLKKNRKKIKEVIGEDPFTKDGKIKVRAIKKIIKAIKEGKLRTRNKPTILRRLYLALTLKKLAKRM